MAPTEATLSSAGVETFINNGLPRKYVAGARVSRAIASTAGRGTGTRMCVGMPKVVDELGSAVTSPLTWVYYLLCRSVLHRSRRVGDEHISSRTSTLHSQALVPLRSQNLNNHVL